MSEPAPKPAPSRRRFRLSLRTLFVLLTLVSAVCWASLEHRRASKLDATNARLLQKIDHLIEAYRDVRDRPAQMPEGERHGTRAQVPDKGLSEKGDATDSASATINRSGFTENQRCPLFV